MLNIRLEELWQNLKERMNSNMEDYSGDMSFYQNQLAKKGISKEQFDMDNFVGLTSEELQNLVDHVNLKSKGE